MARFMSYKEGEILIDAGDESTAAYLIRSGWLQVSRPRGDGSVVRRTLGPGEIVGELGLAGVTRKRTATVSGLTDGVVEVIDRGTLIRLVNGPGEKLTPLLAALFARLQSVMVEPDACCEEPGGNFGRLEGLNAASKRALCNQNVTITHLPWIFGSWQGPRSVTDLFRAAPQIDVRLADPDNHICEHHLSLECSEDGAIALHLIPHGGVVELNGESLRSSHTAQRLPLAAGEHTLAFGHPNDPYRFRLTIPA